MSDKRIHEEDKGFYVLNNPKPNYLLRFAKGDKTVGIFDFDGKAMRFEGDLTESGKLFVNWVLGEFQQRIDDAVKAEREECAKVCESVKPFGSQLALQKATIEDCATAIRARGKL